MDQANAVTYPAFKTLLEDLREQVSYNNSLIFQVGNLARTLKAYEGVSPSPSEPEPQREPEGVIEHFQHEVELLKNNNAGLNAVLQHLHTLIGV